MFGENAFDLVVDVSEAFELMVEMSWCHQSQVTEWLPWVGRHDMDYPKSIDEWRVTLERRYAKAQRGAWTGRPADGGFFTVTAWGDSDAGAIEGGLSQPYHTARGRVALGQASGPLATQQARGQADVRA